MYLNFDDFKSKLKNLGTVYRDVAPKNQVYPFWVYDFISRRRKQASNKTLLIVDTYQVSLFTKGTEKEFDAFYKEFDGFNFSDMQCLVENQNEEVILHFFVEVDVLNE